MYMGIKLCLGITIYMSITMIHVKQDAIPYWCQESMIATDDDSQFFTQQHVGQLLEIFFLYVKSKSIVFLF